MAGKWTNPPNHGEISTAEPISWRNCAYGEFQREAFVNLEAVTDMYCRAVLYEREVSTEYNQRKLSLMLAKTEYLDAIKQERVPELVLEKQIADTTRKMGFHTLGNHISKLDKHVPELESLIIQKEKEIIAWLSM
jgi:hypothetical protein